MTKTFGIVILVLAVVLATIVIFREPKTDDDSTTENTIQTSRRWAGSSEAEADRKERIRVQREKQQLFEERKQRLEKFNGKPFDPDLLSRLAETTTERNKFVIKLICDAAYLQDQSFQYLLDLKNLQNNKDLNLALKAYDYNVNGNVKALQYVLDRMLEDGGDSPAFVVASYLDEWTETPVILKKVYHNNGFDGAGHYGFYGLLKAREQLYPNQRKILKSWRDIIKN